MSLQYKDYYAQLGVPRTATDADIKKAFRKLAREYHPDVAKDKKMAEEKFKEINEAYEVLGDAAKRKRYDELGANWKSGSEFRPPPGWDGFRGGRPRSPNGPRTADYEFQFGGTGFSDFFEQMFGARQASRAGRTGRPAEDELSERGRDVEGDLMVTLEEALRGSQRAVNVQHAVTCDDCSGTGRRGQHLCSTCSGERHTVKSQTYQVKIPPGVAEGQRLRVAGRGEAGAHGGSAGDLILCVRLARHPDFEVEEHNLIYEVALAPWEAVLGMNLSVPTLDGRVNIKIPPGTQNGQKLRVRGRGLPQRAADNGDLIVVAHVAVPVQITDGERLLWEKLAHESKFKPRE